MTQVAIVSGGTSGIGRAVALRLADDGFFVTAFSNDSVGVGQLSPEAAGPGRIDSELCDVRDEPAVAALVERVVARHGRIDAVCAAAGIKRAGTTAETSLADWEETLAINVSGAFLLARAVLPAMVAQQGGSIVFIGSPSEDGDAGNAAYAASKGALAALAATLAREHLRDGIRVNRVVAGSTRTAMNSDRPEHINELLGRFNVAGRVNEPGDVAAAVSYLVSDRAATISGAALHVGWLPGVAPALPRHAVEVDAR